MKTNLSLKTLNKNQKKAVLATQGPVLVLAGAGSGKTKTLIFRIAHLIENLGIKGENILAVTFTNKAATEMQQRVSKLINRDNTYQSFNLFYPSNFPFIGTFHSFGLRVLKEDAHILGIKKNFTLIDENDKLSLIKKIIKSLDLSFEEINPKAIIWEISQQKNRLISANKYQTENYFQEQVKKIYFEYEKSLKLNNVLDFDDLITLPIKIWEKKPNILEKYQNHFTYLLVDEYQDTNNAQYRITQALSQKHHNIFVVGDDYQSIYGWRGANVNNILNFEKDYHKTQTIYLEENYRNTKNILLAAQNIIKENPNQKHKSLWTQNITGSSLVSYEASHEIDEALFITEKIQALKKKDPSLTFKDFAILYRINAQSRILEEQFLFAGIPYRVFGSIHFFSRTEIKDTIAYLRLIVNKNDRLSLERIINIPKRGLGKKTLEQIFNAVEQTKLPLKETLFYLKQTINKKAFLKKILTLENFLNQLERIEKKGKKYPLDQFISLVIKETGYKTFLLSLGEDGKERLENVLELLTMALKFIKMPLLEALASFLEEVTMFQSEKNTEQQQDVVTLMTLHSSKGLEFKNIFLPGFEEGLMPHSRALNDPMELEEERRLCYVGITRAKEKIFFSNARNRRLFGQYTAPKPSRFLDNIPEEILEKQTSPPLYGEYLEYPETDGDFWEEREKNL